MGNKSYKFLDNTRNEGFMKKNLILIYMVCISSSAFAGGFNDCYAKAFQSLNNLDSVKVCAGVGTEFNDCYKKAYESLSNLETVKVCAPRSQN